MNYKEINMRTGQEEDGDEEETVKDTLSKQLPEIPSIGDEPSPGLLIIPPSRKEDPLPPFDSPMPKLPGDKSPDRPATNPEIN